MLALLSKWNPILLTRLLCESVSTYWAQRSRTGGEVVAGWAVPHSHTLSLTHVWICPITLYAQGHTVWKLDVESWCYSRYFLWHYKVKIMRKFCRYQLVCTDVLSHAVGPPALLQATTPCLWKLSTRSAGPGGEAFRNSDGILTFYSASSPVLLRSIWERTPQTWNLWAPRGQNRAGVNFGRHRNFFEQFLRQKKFVLSQY